MASVEPTIVCPSCKTEIKLTESLAAPLVEAVRRDYEERLTRKDADVAKRETALRERETALAKAGENLDAQVAEKLARERAGIAADEARKARLALGGDLDRKAKELAELQDVLKARDLKLAEAQKAQAELMRKERELDDARREMELTVEKRVQESLSAARDQARREAEESLKLKVMEKEQTIAGMQRQIEDLKRRAEQGSQQAQGEVQELELENLLRERFPRDTIEPVGKGESGGDVFQRVTNPSGQVVGTILWESKRTKNWSNDWLPKLRGDQRAAGADAAVLVTQALPKETESFGLIDEVWVTPWATALPLAAVLRRTLVDVSFARQSAEGQQTKAEMVYGYLTGPRFKQRVQAIVEAFSSMSEDLEKERKAIMKQWAKREEQIRRVLEGTVGMYGDLQGIAGSTLQEIEGLDIKALGDGAPPDQSAIS